MTDNTYATIELDPPWKERGGGKIKRGADRHYPLMSRADILATVVKSEKWRPADDCHMWMWATSNHLPDALWLIDALGFTYKTQAVWVKLRAGAKVSVDVRKSMLAGDPLSTVLRTGLATGLGQYLRGQHELLLLSTKGSGYAVRTEPKNIPSVILAPRGKHSAKPDAAYAMIEDRSKGPRLSMFSRDPRDRWDVWGPMPGHRFVVKVCGKIRSGHQLHEDAVRWCRIHGCLENASTGEIVLSDGMTIEEVL